MVAYGRCSLKRVEPERVSFEKTSFEEDLPLAILSYDMFSSMLSLVVLSSTHFEQTLHYKWSLTRGLKTVRTPSSPKSSRGCLLKAVANYGASTGKILLLRGGGRTWSSEVVLTIGFLLATTFGQIMMGL